MVKNLQVNCPEKISIKKAIIHKLISLLKTELQFDIISLPINFIYSEQIVRINKQYLNHNYSTDIITFNYTGNTSLLDGEIFISVEDADENAKRFKATFIEEILRLVIHGILHLIGYDDLKKNDRVKMKKMENKLLNKYKQILLESGIDK